MHEESYPVVVTKENLNPENRGMSGWHWHDTIEFAVVLSGNVDFYVNETCISLHDGEGIFINADSLHYVEAAKDSNATLFFISIPPESIAPRESFLYRKYVQTVLEDKALCGFALRLSCEWQKPLLAKLNSIYALTRHPCFACEMQLQTLINDAWFQLLLQRDKLKKQAAPSLEKQKSGQRIKAMLTYIQENYAMELTIQDIADSAGISKSECFRCFQNVIHKKPITYVNEYRVERAMQLLASTSLSVAEICHLCGFHHESYFGKWFRRTMGITPLQYKKSLSATGYDKVPG